MGLKTTHQLTWADVLMGRFGRNKKVHQKRTHQFILKQLYAMTPKKSRGEGMDFLQLQLQLQPQSIYV